MYYLQIYVIFYLVSGTTEIRKKLDFEQNTQRKFHKNYIHTHTPDSSIEVRKTMEIITFYVWAAVVCMLHEFTAVQMLKNGQIRAFKGSFLNLFLLLKWLKIDANQIDCNSLLA